VQSVHDIIKHSAGVAMAFLCAKVIRGGRKPLLLSTEVTSKAADACGDAVFIPTCAETPALMKSIKK